MEILAPDTVKSGVWNEYVRAGYSTWQPGQASEIHSHSDAAEVFIFFARSCGLSTNGETQRVGAGCTIDLDPGEKHQLKAVGDRSLEMFMALMPNHAPTHTFYRPDGTAAHWNRPAPGSLEAGQRPMGLTKQDLEQEDP